MRKYEADLLSAIVLGLRDAGAINDAAVNAVTLRIEEASYEAEKYSPNDGAMIRELAVKLREAVKHR